MIINESLSVFKTFYLHHLFDTHFLISNHPYKFNNISITCIELTIWI